MAPLYQIKQKFKGSVSEGYIVLVKGDPIVWFDIHGVSGNKGYVPIVYKSEAEAREAVTKHYRTNNPVTYVVKSNFDFIEGQFMEFV